MGYYCAWLPLVRRVKLNGFAASTAGCVRLVCLALCAHLTKLSAPMLPVRIGSASLALKSLSVQATGGTLDAFHVQVTGVTGGTLAERRAYLLSVLSAIVVTATSISPGGASAPLVSRMTGEAFRQINNNSGGFLSAEDGFFYVVGRKNFTPEQGIAVHLDWTTIPATPGGLDSSAAQIVVRRCRAVDDAPATATLVYEAQPVTKETQEFSSTLAGLSSVFLLVDPANLVSVETAYDGKSYANDAGFLSALTSFSTENEQTEDPVLIGLWDTIHAGAYNPVFTVKVTTPGGHFVQIGQTI